MKTLKLFLAVILLAFLANSCNNPLSPPHLAKPGKLPAGKGSFSLKIAGAGRTIMPKEQEQQFTSESLYYELIFTSLPGGKETTVDRTYEKRAEPVILDVGTYSLVVNAYINEKKDQLLFSGTADNIKIQKDIPATAEVQLEPVMVGGGTGRFSWDITFPDSVLIASMSIAKRGSNGEPAPLFELNFEDYDRQVKGEEELSSGFYDVTITMTGYNSDYGHINVTRKELLHIYNDRVSPYKNDFTEINFNIVYTVTLKLGGNNEPVYVVHGDTISGYVSEDNLALSKPASKDAYLYSDVAPDEPYIFGGWYLDNDFYEKWADDTPVTSALTLYPKWSDDSVDVSGKDGNTNFEKIVNYINGIANVTASGYTLIIAADEVALGKTLNVNSGITLTVTSAGNTASTINRGFLQENANSGLLVVLGELTLENVIIDGQKGTYNTNAAPLVRVNEGGTFTMNDGIISGNTAANGGGVYVGSSGTFTMTGGTISGNSEGGGVYVNANGTFNMTGGTITGNTATTSTSGCGVICYGTLILGGEVIIKGNKNGNDENNNVYLARDVSIQIGMPFTESAEIWVTTATQNNGQIINNSAESGVEQYFRSDVADGYFIINNVTTQLVLKTDLAFDLIDGDAAYSVMDYTGTPINPIDVIIPAWYNGKLVTEIGAGAFYDKQLIKTVTFAEGSQLTSIGGGAFRSCNGLTSITIPEGVTAINPYTFSTCNSLASISIPASVTSIGEGAFESTNITSIIIPATVTSIGSGAFSYCGDLTSITILEGVTEIGDNAFLSCAAIRYITIPASVKTIGDFAFSYCSLLEEVTLLAEYPPTLGQSVFSNAYSNLMIIVPLGYGDTYRGTAGWSSYKIVAEDDEEE